jgi:hypothetical protein
MKLTQRQIDHVKQKQIELNRLIKAHPKYGLFTFAAQLEALNMMVELHNLEIEAERKASIEKGKENLKTDASKI